MAKDPAFLFYSSDFIIGTAFFSNEQVGKYVKLLCFQHQMGHLKESDLLAVCGSKDETIFSKFKIDSDGKYYNERLENESVKRKKFTQSRVKSLSIDNGDIVFIYLLHDPDSSFYKIGSSKYPELRLKDQQKHNPKILIYWSSDVLVERIVEKRLHEKFETKKIKYDWFNLSDEDLEDIKEFVRTESRTEDENVNENVINKELPKTTTEEKVNFLEFVQMTQGQYDQLAKKLGKTVLDEYVERLNNYIGSKGKRYKSHYHTILSWTNKDGKKPIKTKKPKPDCWMCNGTGKMKAGSDCSCLN